MESNSSAPTSSSKPSRPSEDISSSPKGNLDNLQKQRWKEARSDLQTALETWDLISGSIQGPSADEKRLQEMRLLLHELKEKLVEFDSSLKNEVNL